MSVKSFGICTRDQVGIYVLRGAIKKLRGINYSNQSVYNYSTWRGGTENCDTLGMK